MPTSRGTRRNRVGRAKAAGRARTSFDLCPSCGKRRYPTQAAALDAIAGSGGVAGGRVYECTGGWHITSQRRRT